VESPLGWVPLEGDLDTAAIPGFGSAQFKAVMAVDRNEWRRELLLHEELFEKLYDRLPWEFPPMRQLLLASLWRLPRD
jgi:phosphoenolpyruvate carboxykinase (GTP)